VQAADEIRSIRDRIEEERASQEAYEEEIKTIQQDIID
jgi:hypothetical protein